MSQVTDAVAGLARSHQEVIALRYGAGLDGAAVAKVLGVREPAVRARLFRALRRLRQELEVTR